MPPRFASILTTIFILFLLRLERKQNPTASYALWIPTLWMLLVTGKAVAGWFGIGGAYTEEEGSVLDRQVLSAFLVIGLLILMKRHFNWINGIRDNTYPVLLIGFMLVSILWSDVPFVSLKRWTREGGIAIVMAFVVSTEVDPPKALKSLFRRIIYVHMPLSILLIKYYPDLAVTYTRWSGDRMWIGVSTQKNGLALLCLFAIFFLLWTLIRRWRGLDIPVTWYQTYIEVFIIMLSIWLFMGPERTLTYSSTSTAALAAGVISLLGLIWLKRRNIIMRGHSLAVFILLVILYGTVTPFVGGLTIFDVSALLGRDKTLTGRSDIWAALIPYAIQSPFLGHGFGGFWNKELRATIDVEAHNGYLDTILNIGITGLIFWSIFLIASCRKAQREMMQDFDWGIFWFCIILMAVIHNIAESSMTSFSGLMPVVILFLNISSRSKNLTMMNSS